MTRRSIKIGISSCLLGQKVRYDGGHKLDAVLMETFRPFVEWIPVCPEVESGLPVPREAMRLAGGPSEPRLVTVDTGIDHTERLVEWSQRKIRLLEHFDLSGFIFKGRSPSCGLRNIEDCGAGIFARMFMQVFPLLPMDDDEMLHDPLLRASFIERIFNGGNSLW